MGQNTLWSLTRELEVRDYTEFEDDEAYITDKGKKRLEDYVAGLTPEEIRALKLQDKTTVLNILVIHVGQYNLYLLVKNMV